MTKTAIVLTALLIVSVAPISAQCSLTQQCSGGGSITCNGPSGTCTSGPDYITCNGTTYRCPLPPCTADIECAYGGFISCSINSGHCEEGSDYVTCVGSQIYSLTCAQCEPAIFCSVP